MCKKRKLKNENHESKKAQIASGILNGIYTPDDISYGYANYRLDHILSYKNSSIEDNSTKIYENAIPVKRKNIVSNSSSNEEEKKEEKKARKEKEKALKGDPRSPRSPGSPGSPRNVCSYPCSAWCDSPPERGRATSRRTGRFSIQGRGSRAAEAPGTASPLAAPRRGANRSPAASGRAAVDMSEATPSIHPFLQCVQRCLPPKAEQAEAPSSRGTERRLPSSDGPPSLPAAQRRRSAERPARRARALMTTTKDLLTIDPWDLRCETRSGSATIWSHT